MKTSNERATKEYVLIGGAGAPNYGDELIVKGWIQYFSKRKEKAKVYFYENIASNAKRLHTVTDSSAQILFKDDLVKIAKKSQSKITFWEQILRGYRFYERNGPKLYPEADLAVFERADRIHLHGGGYLNNYDPEKGFYIGFVAAINKHFGTKIIATGIGFGPVEAIPEKYKNTLNEIFSRFSRFELRDIDGFRKLSNGLGNGSFVYGVDDCYLLSLNEIFSEPKDNKRRLFLSFLDYNVDDVDDVFWNSLQEYAKEFHEVLFFESYPWEDASVFKSVASRISDLKLLTVKNTIQGTVVANSQDVVITNRFHVHFIFSRYGCRGYYGKDSEYYEVKHQSIMDRGSGFQPINFKVPFMDTAPNNTSYITQNDEIYRKLKLNLANQFYK